MVVRLSDLRSGRKPEEEKNSGVVRLSDIRQKRQAEQDEITRIAEAKKKTEYDNNTKILNNAGMSLLDRTQNLDLYGGMVRDTVGEKKKAKEEKKATTEIDIAAKYGMTPQELAETRAANELKYKPQFEKLERMDAQAEKVRSIPLVGDALRGLDKTAEKTKPVSDIGLALYTPGAGLGVLSAATRSGGAALSRMIPGIANSAGGRIAQTAVTEAAIGAPTGAANVMARNPQATNRELLEGAGYGAAGGAVLGGLGRGGIEGFASLRNTAEDTIRGQLNGVRALERADNAKQYSGNLRLDNQEQNLTRVRASLADNVTEAMTPPLENEKLLRAWVKPHLGNPSNSEMAKFSYEDLRQLAEEIRTTLNQFDIERNIARSRGIDLSRAADEAPSLSNRVGQDATRRAFGAKPTDLPPVSRPLVNPPTPKPPAPEIPIAPAPNPTSSTNPKPLFRVGDTAIPTSADGSEISRAERIVDIQSKDGIHYYRFTGSNTYMPENQVKRPQNSPSAPMVPGAPVRPRIDTPMEPTASNAGGRANEVPTLPGVPVKTSQGTARRSDIRGQEGVPVLSGPQLATPEVTASTPRVPGVPNSKPVKNKPRTAGVRANFANQLDNGNFSDELEQGIRSTDQTYDVATNKASVAAANKAVKDLPTAESDFLLNQSGGAEHIAIGYRLMQKLDAQGEHARALVVSKKLAEDLTKSGQTTQAASILSRLSPEGQLLNLVNTAAKNGKEVSVADSIKFKELAAKVQETSGAGVKANQFNEILDRLERGENVSVADIKKLSDYLSGAEKVVKPNVKSVAEDLPVELKDVKKREKIISLLDNAEQAALARIAARRNRVNALPLDEWADHAIVVSAQIAKGTIRAASHVEDLVKLFGEEIRPVASQVFQKAQGLVRSVSRKTGEGDLEKAQQVLRRATGQTAAEKAIVAETSKHVKKLIADAKAGKLDPADIQKLRDYSDEIAEMTENAKPVQLQLPTQEERFLQSVKALAKKIAKVESDKIPLDQANREVSSLLRQVVKISDEGLPGIMQQPIDNKALSDIAHDVMAKTRPTPKPTTLQEKIVEKYIKANPEVSQKDIDSLRDLAKNITRLSGDAKLDSDIAMQKILNSYEKSNSWDKILALRYMGMLLNSSTQAINAFSGPIMATTSVAADVFGTMLDIAMNKVLKTPRTTTLYGTNPLKFIARYYKNLKIGGKAGYQGVNPAGIQGTNEIRGLAFKNMKNPLTFVPALGERVLGAVAKGPDFATYKSVFDSEMVKQGYLSAKNSGIKGKDNIKNHIQQFVNDPPEEAILQADRIGKNTTFQRSDTTGGKLANYLNNSPTLVKPGVNAIFPFVRTPVNIASTAVTLTPAGIIKGLFQLSSKSDATRREAIRTLSMGVTGTGIGALGYYLSQVGIITGANDSGNKDVDNIREQAGKGKYRFNTSGLQRYMSALLNGEGSEAAETAAKYQKGDKQFDYNKLQPLAFPLAIGAGANDNKDKGTAGQIGGAGVDAFGSLFGMSTLKGVQTVFQPNYGGTQGEKALGVPSRIAESFFKSFSWGGLAQEARRQDPIQRKTPFNDGIVENTTEYFKSRIPGLSESLPARKTTLGQDYKNAPGIKGSYLNPYRSEVAPYNKAAEIISGLIDRTGDIKLAPSAPEKTVRGKDRTGATVSIKIPQDRYAQLQEDVGNKIVEKITALPDLDDKRLAVEIEKIYSKVREREMNKVKRELGIRISG